MALPQVMTAVSTGSMSVVPPVGMETTVVIAFPMEIGKTTVIPNIAGRKPAPAATVGRKQQVIPSPTEAGVPFRQASTAEANPAPAVTLERKRRPITSSTGIGRMLLPPATAEVVPVPVGIRPLKRQSIPLRMAHGLRMTPSTGVPTLVPVATPRRNPGAMQIPLATDTATPATTSWRTFQSQFPPC